MASSKLHDAVRHDKCRLITRLVSEGVSPNALDNNGNTALYVALIDGPINAVPYLLQAGADPNFRCSGDATPVHAACRRGSRHLLQQLLECGGDLRLRDVRGRTPQDWALEHSDPQCRRKLVTFINTRRALAYRFEDAAALLDEDASVADVSGSSAATTIRRRFARPKRLWSTERLKADGGFGVVYCSPSKETGNSTFVPFVPSMYLYNSEDGNILWSGPQSVVQNMYWDKLKVSVKKSSMSGSSAKGPCSDILITELEKIRKLTWHPYFLWPLGVSPVQNMDDVMLVFECVHFGTVFDVLHKTVPETYSGPLNKNQLLLVMQQACEALLFLHSRKWVHGCVSSHCVYVISPCLGKLGSFEFVQRSEEAGGGRLPYSAPAEDFLDYYYHWMAPEVLQGRRPNRLSDVYQVCAVLWELFTEQVPWGTADREVVERHLLQERSGLPQSTDIPAPLDALVSAGLCPDPLDRDTDLEEIYQVLSAMVQESFTNLGFLTNRREHSAENTRVTKSTPAQRVHSRQTSVADAAEPTYSRPQKATRKQSSVLLDDVSDAFDELISLADDDAPKTPQRRGRTVDLLGPKFDQVSLSSSLDPMDFTEGARVPTFSCRHDKGSSEACTQTDTSRAPTVRPRTRAFGASCSASNIKLATRYTDTVLMSGKAEPSLVAQRGEVLASAPNESQDVLQTKMVRPIGFVTQPAGRRNVRPCKPASHSYGLSPFMQSSRNQQRSVADATSSEASKLKEMSQRKSCFTEGRTSEEPLSFVSRRLNLRRMDAAILEDPVEDDNRHDARPLERDEAQTLAKQLAHDTFSTKGTADFPLPPSFAIAGEEGDTADNEVKSVQTEPNHAYKVEVVTMTCPVVQHTLTVTSTNLITGESVVTEESTGAEVVQVQWNPEDNNINISTPDASFNTSGP
ncbi:inactive serine/threonine-protein kinase TEX14 [Ixodes scapularis]